LGGREGIGEAALTEGDEKEEVLVPGQDAVRRWQTAVLPRQEKQAATLPRQEKQAAALPRQEWQQREW
jgi:hypothetical protein